MKPRELAAGIRRNHDRRALLDVSELLLAREAELIDDLLGDEDPVKVQHRLKEVRYLRDLLKEPVARNASE